MYRGLTYSKDTSLITRYQDSNNNRLWTVLGRHRFYPVCPVLVLLITQQWKLEIS